MTTAEAKQLLNDFFVGQRKAYKLCDEARILGLKNPGPNQPKMRQLEREKREIMDPIVLQIESLGIEVENWFETYTFIVYGKHFYQNDLASALNELGIATSE